MKTGKKFSLDALTDSLTLSTTALKWATKTPLMGNALYGKQKPPEAFRGVSGYIAYKQ